MAEAGSPRHGRSAQEEPAPSTRIDAANPWPGLDSFTEDSRAFFHGRDQEIAELSRRVQRKLLTVLFGQSGLGKTSILRAGLAPRLRSEGYVPVYVRLDYGREAPAPAEQIRRAIVGALPETGVQPVGESLWEFFHQREPAPGEGTERSAVPLLIFDQFEEIFTLAQSDDAGRHRAQAFLTELADLVENRPPTGLEARMERDEALADTFDFGRADYRVLLALREDYLAHLEALKGAMPSITQNRLRLARMSGAQALDAVVRPGAGLVNEEVARQIVRFVSGAADPAAAEVEPSLLSLVCRELNEARRSQARPEISADLLAGSRETILQQFYERALGDQPASVRAFVEDEFLTDSGYRESLAEERVVKGLGAAAGGDGAVVLATLVNRRLLRVEERLDRRRVELTHDVLCEVVRASRDERQARESKAAIERQLAATRATEAATRKALWRARMVAVGCAVLALAAVASALYGYVSQRQARDAERDALAAADTARAAQVRAVAAQVRAVAAADAARRAEAQAVAARQSETELRGLAEKRLQSELSARQEAEQQAARAERERNRAQAAEKAAETEAEVSRAVNDFIRNDLLAQASPDRQPNRDITLRAVLDRAAQNIEGRFAGRPLVEASIRATLAGTYSSLGEFPEMLRQLERALPIFQREQGAEHPNTLLIMGRLVDAYRGLGRFTEAETLGRSTLDVKQRVLGAEHPSTIGSMLSLCLVYRTLGKLKDAEDLGQAALALQRRVSGDDHPDTMASLQLLASIYRMRDKLVEAEAMFTQVLAVFERQLGPEHPNTLGVMGALARVHHDRGKLTAAEPLYAKVLERQNRILGDKHPSTLATLFQLADLYREQDKLGDSELLFERVLLLQRQVFGAEHPNVAVAQAALAHVLGRQGKFDEAETKHREALALLSKLQGPNHPSLIMSHANFGRTLLSMQKYAEAERAFREAARIAEQSVPDGWERYGAQFLIGQALLALKRVDEAKSLMQEAYHGMIAAKAPAAWQDEAMRTLTQLSIPVLRFNPASRLLDPAVPTPAPPPPRQGLPPP